MYPDADIDVSDLRTDSLEFLSKQFGVNAWVSDPDPDKLQAPGTYDLIWSGSVLTHLPEEITVALMRKFLSWLNPNGVAVVTTHGRRVLQNLHERRLRYMGEDQEPSFLQQLGETGYAYVPYKGQPIGVSANTIPWLTDVILGMSARVVTISEHAWDKHQDVVALQAPGPR
jgi:trans-aconitate methyltransferase